jgi:hypothetical protein
MRESDPPRPHETSHVRVWLLHCKKSHLPPQKGIEILAGYVWGPSVRTAIRHQNSTTVRNTITYHDRFAKVE